MNAKEIRRQFLSFFESKDHKVVPSSPIVVKNDPTLMFTNAGMNQFKDYFLGDKQPDQRRVADTQKCLRVSGKHNDLEEVGVDTYHHTMFEMLGNWSFGDYFKKEAIEWAWELLTKVYNLPESRIYVTVFEGDQDDGLSADQEAVELWKQFLPQERILLFDKSDNFWEMGDTGPCGPCSEIHIDMRPEDELARQSGAELVNQDHPQVIEIWNLVFMQYDRKSSGKLEELPDKHIDTGMGFERLVLAIEGKTSNYDTSVFQPLIKVVCEQSGKTYGQDEKTDVAIRVMADHIRAITFAVADGQLPSNTGAGYVIRRILRRAVRYGYTFLGFEQPVLYKLVDVLAHQFDEVFPEVVSQKDFIKKVVEEEEASFLRTLTTGIKRLDQMMAEHKKDKVLDGEKVFELYDTYGFPSDLTALIAREQGFGIDDEGFKKAMARQKDRSKAAATTSAGDWEVIKEHGLSEFVGYDKEETNVTITRYRKVETKKDTIYQFVLDQTPFYPEGGGQVGDKGILEAPNGDTIKVFDTKKENDLIIHFTKQLPDKLEGDFLAKIDRHKRHRTAMNHSATHLLHAALKQVLGEHVNQKGSLVNDQLLRFDFSHFSKVSPEEIVEIEKIVNERVRQNILLNEQRNVPIKEALNQGAMALFGEKYGDEVRVITFDPDFSVELCGGTHISSTGEIGLFKIVSESSVAAGVRRIEAYTADRAEEYVQKQLEQLETVKGMLKNPKDVTKAVQQLMDEKSGLQKRIEGFEQQQVQQLKDTLLQRQRQVGDKAVIIEKINADSADVLKQIAFDLRKSVDNLALVLAADVKGKPVVSVMFADSILEAYDLHAGKLVKDLAAAIQGGGGGQPFFATAGGKNIDGLDNVIIKAREVLG